ncbi:MAG TPA: hypothetical protein VE967_10445 [Gemmatimonadaceae bacterium]|nr:hypothetical protein [Gemmatimonadaceae bacterium]
MATTKSTGGRGSETNRPASRTRDTKSKTRSGGATSGRQNMQGSTPGTTSGSTQGKNRTRNTEADENTNRSMKPTDDEDAYDEENDDASDYSDGEGATD